MLLEHEVDHLHPSGAEVKNEWSYSSAPPVYIGDAYMDSVKLTLQLDKTYSFKISRHILSILKLLETEVYVFSKESRLAVVRMQPCTAWVPQVFSLVIKQQA
jgi:hypothetical protein